MAGFDGLQTALTTMQPLQLVAALVAAPVVALAFDSTLGPRLRRAAIGTGLAAALVFVLSAAGWVSGLALMALGGLGMALFVVAVRLLSRLLDIDSGSPPASGPLGASEPGELRVARRTLPQRPRPAIRAI